MEKEFKIDPLTKEKFIPKRSNQIFEYPDNKTKYNNRKASILNKERAFFDKPCRKSHIVLKSLYDPNSENIHNMHFLVDNQLQQVSQMS